MDEPTAISNATSLLGLTSVVPFARGGQKLVCRATLGSSDVVLKIVLLNPGTDPNVLERCEREVSLLSTISSPNLVSLESGLVSLGSPVEAVAWLEELLDGQDLAMLLGAQFGEADVLKMLVEVGTGLAAMHRSGYVHRDLSPANIRRTAAGLWKVMDPGFAKHLNRSSITGVWQPGTLGYISPEHAGLGGRVTPASDVFCLGVLAYQMLAAELPIQVGGDRDDYRRRLLNAQAESIGTKRPDLAADLVELVDQCLNRQPARRFLDATEVVLEASRILTGGTR
jgi:eukaryotic-like serine/threonine-protein kinase